MLTPSHMFGSSEAALGRSSRSLSNSRTRPSGQRGLERRELGPPDQPDTLLNVVSQTSPQGFQADLGPSSQAELAQPDLGFNPGVGEFGHPSPLFINGLSRGGAHLGLEGGHRRGIFEAHDGTPFLVLRTTLGFQSARLARRAFSSVAVTGRGALFLLPFIGQGLAGRTSVTIRDRIIDKRCREELWAYSSLPQRRLAVARGVWQRSDQ